MIVAAPHILLSLRWIPPGVIILGSAPLFLAEWGAIRLISLPLPSRWYRRMDEFLYGSYQAMVGFLYEVWSGVEFCYYGDKIPDTPENVLYISNHQCTVDWVIAEVLCVKQGNHGGRLRYILKDALKYIPLYGWYLGNRGGIFVRRQRGKDQLTLINGLQKFVKDKTSVWLVLFPEGTRYTPQRVKGSNEYARNLGVPELKHVLTPKSTGFELALKHVGSHFDAVYDVTICYEGMSRRGQSTPPHIFNYFCGPCKKVHIHVRRIPFSDMPEDEEGQRAWLHDAYQRKDKILHEILTEGQCHAPKVPHPLPLSYWLPASLFHGAVLMAVLGTRVGRISWLSLLGVFTAVTLLSPLLTTPTK